MAGESALLPPVNGRTATAPVHVLNVNLFLQPFAGKQFRGLGLLLSERSANEMFFFSQRLYRDVNEMLSKCVINTVFDQKYSAALEPVSRFLAISPSI